METPQIAHEITHEPAETAEATKDTGELAGTGEGQAEKKMSRYQRFYHLHREERNEQQKNRYNNKPEVQAKREERERKKAEKEEAKRLAKEEAKKLKEQAKELKRQEKLQLALASRKPPKET